MKVILVNSDGDDDTSRRGLIQLEAIAGRPDILMYAVGPPGIPDSSGQRNAMIELTRLTGGRYFMDGTSNVGSKVALSLRGRYVLGYKPSNGTKDGKYRKLKVEIRRTGGSSNLRVVTRPGYYALP